MLANILHINLHDANKGVFKREIITLNMYIRKAWY